YEAMFANMAAAVMPTDGSEGIWRKDCVDLTWEIRRIRLAKAGMIDATRKEAVKSMLESILEHNELIGWDRISQADVKADGWYNDPAIRERSASICPNTASTRKRSPRRHFALRARELEEARSHARL